MSLAADHSTLPRAAAPIEGAVPDAHPRFVGLLAAKWAQQNDDDKPTALGTRVRHSDAGKCARAISYTAAEIPKSDPMDLTGVWNVSLGTLIHEHWQSALSEQFPGAEIEPKVGHDDLDASGHLDAIIRTTDKVICYELKTIGGFGFKGAIGKAGRGRPAEGPKVEHLMQASLNGLACDADEVVIGYLAKECVSINAGRDLSDLGRFAAEWTFTRDEYEPIAHAEKARLQGILALIDKGELAARKFPGRLLPPGAEITDPATGRWEVHDAEGVLADAGSWWACGYCSFRTLCAKTPSGRVPIESVVSL